jgi:hypothetical protein
MPLVATGLQRKPFGSLHIKTLLAGLALIAGSANAATILWDGTTVTHMVNNGVAADNYAQLIAGTFQEAGHAQTSNSYRQ